MSLLDRLIRIVLGVFFVIYSQFNMVRGLWSTILLIVSIIAILNGLIGWCGIYSMFGISSKKVRHNRISKKDIKKAVEEHMNVSKSSKTPATKKKAVAKKVVPKNSVAKKVTKTATKKPASKKVTSKSSKTPASKKAVKKTTTKKVKK